MKKVSKVFLALFLCLSPLVLFEFFLRYRNFNVSGLQRYITLREFTPHTDISSQTPSHSYCNKPDTKTYRIRADKDGFILPYISSSENQSREKVFSNREPILFLGGSTTANIYVNENYRFPILTTTKINQFFNSQRFYTLNSGVSGNNSAHSILSLYAKGLKYNPKIIFFMHNVNDLTVLLRANANYNNELPTRKLMGNISFSYWAMLTLKKFLPYTAENIIKPAKNLLTAKNQEFDSSHTKSNLLSSDDYEKIKSSLIEEFRSNIRIFISIAKSKGAVPILMTQPNRISGKHDLSPSCFGTKPLTTVQYIDIYSAFNNLIRDESTIANIPLVDLEKKVPKSSFYFRDAVHLTNEGNKIVSEEIVVKLMNILQKNYIDQTN